MITSIRKPNRKINIFEIKLITLVTLFALLLASCGGGGSADRVKQEQLNERKENTSENLNNILHDIEERIDVVEEYLEDAGGEAKKELEESREVLIQQKEIIEEELNIIEAATLDTWNDVIDNTSAKIQEVRAETNDVTRKIREFLEE